MNGQNKQNQQKPENSNKINKDNQLLYIQFHFQLLDIMTFMLL